SEKDDSEDVPNGVCEGPVTRENPLFWNGEADRGVADEDVGLVHREVSSSEQLRELGFMETQRALPPVPGLQGDETRSMKIWLRGSGNFFFGIGDGFETRGEVPDDMLSGITILRKGETVGNQFESVSGLGRLR
ncbi:hypothetical protein V6N12_024687, partial [Hibiscus sabdariffa]